MALRFAPSSWVQRTNTNLLGGGPRSGFLSSFDDVVLVTSVISFTGGNPQWAVNDGCASFDRMSSWQQNDTNGAWPETVYQYHSSRLPDGTVRYIRMRYRFGRSFFIANNEIPAGFIAMDISDDGITWAERQQLYSWSHHPDTGSGGQAGSTIGVHFLFLPGSGPGGADADWALVRGNVSSGQGTLLDVFHWWRSDDFGLSWTFVRDAVGTGLTALPVFITRGGQGGGFRLVAEIGGATLGYSDDDGATWIGTPGGLAGPKTEALEQAGQTWCGFISGTGTGGGSVFLSCDNFVSVVGGQLNMSVTNANWAAVRLSPCEILGTISAGIGNGQHIWYSTNGGETFTDQGIDLRMVATQAGNIFMGLFRDGAPFIVSSDAKTFISNDRSTGQPSARTTCPLAFAKLKKSGIPDNCGHPILTRCD